MKVIPTPVNGVMVHTVFASFTHEPLGQSPGRLVHGTLSVLVLDGDDSAALEQILCAILKLPEARVVQRGVAVLVDEVHVGLVLQQLRKKGGETILRL